MPGLSLSVVIPAYNEEAIIKNAVQTALDILTNANADFEIIVVNDGSTDHTADILNKYFSQTPGIKVFHKKVNGGFGAAISQGISMAHKQYIFCVPADSPLNPTLYTLFSANAGKADVLVSYRKKKLGYTPLRLLNSYVFHLLVTVLFNMRLRDYNWIHMYNRRIFDSGKVTISYHGIFMLAEVLIKARNAGYTFYEFEVEQTERLTGIATASKFTAVMATLRDIIKFRLTGK